MGFRGYNRGGITMQGYKVVIPKGGEKVKRNANGTFAKGYSGNPGGRPKECLGWKKKCREWMNERGWNILTSIAEDEKNRFRFDAIRLICAYAYGTPPKEPDKDPSVISEILDSFDF